MTQKKDSTRPNTMHRYGPYPAYKDSGVEWLGVIPVGWGVERLRFVSESNPLPSEVRGLPVATEVSFVPMEAVGEYGGLSLETTRQLADVKAGYTYFRDGDIVVAKITPCFENGKGALAAGLTNGIAFGTTELHVLRTTERGDRRFMFYVTLSDAFRRLGEADMYGAGGQKRISESFVRNFSHAIPSLSEQRAIAAFLERETARIDALVKKKERLIELLQEQRTGLITRAVTKGLDPTVPMKDSGVEWLGEIPTHWEAKRLKRVFRVVNGATPASGEPVFWDGEIPWVTPEDLGDLNTRAISATRRNITEAGYRSCATTLVPAGSLVLSTRAPIGHLALAGVDLCTNQGCRSLLLRDSVSRAFYYYELSATRRELESLGQGSTFRELAKGMLEDVELASPPEPEQRAIAALLDRETARIDTLVTKMREAIFRLRELRAALISAAVTGKIDVRQEAA